MVPWPRDLQTPHPGSLQLLLELFDTSHIVEAFAKADRDNSGSLELSEFIAAVRHVRPELADAQIVPLFTLCSELSADSDPPTTPEQAASGQLSQRRARDRWLPLLWHRAPPSGGGGALRSQPLIPLPEFGLV